MTVAVTFPGSLVMRGAGAMDREATPRPDWGVYADGCWDGWPGIVLDWPDFGVPRDDEAAIAAIVEGVDRARAGQDVLVGCRGGIGRTGTILAAVAVATGVPADRARDWVRARYHAHALETDAQETWVRTRVAGDDRVRTRAAKTRRVLIKTVADRLRAEMSVALHADDPLPRLAWAVPRTLAITQRPLRAHPSYGGSRRDYPPESRPDIDAWIDDLRRQGIRSVVVLNSAKELRHYDNPALADGGLLGLYTRAGLQVVHLPADDPAHDLTARAAFDAAVDDLSTEVAGILGSLALPVVIHCSAAIDRSPPVAARIAVLFEVGQLTPGGS